MFFSHMNVLMGKWVCILLSYILTPPPLNVLVLCMIMFYMTHLQSRQGVSQMEEAGLPDGMSKVNTLPTFNRKSV